MEYPPPTAREGLGLDLPLPPDEHPRLLLRRKDFPKLRSRAEHPLLKASWEAIQRSGALQVDGRLPQLEADSNFDVKVLEAIEARALLYVLSPEKAAGRQAVDAIFHFNRTVVFPEGKGDSCRDLGRLVLATAIVYDWCHAITTDWEKTFLIEWMEGWAAKMEIKWPHLVQNSVSGHGTEAQLSRDLLACAVATYDEKPEIYRRAVGRIMAELVPVRNFFYEAPCQPQGNSYGPYRFQWEMWTTLIFDRMGHPNIVSPRQGAVPYQWIYPRRPDGQLLRSHDDFMEQFRGFGRYWETFGLPYAASYYRDPLLMDEAIRQSVIGENPLFDFLLFDPTTEPKGDRSALPLTRYFAEPLGSMVARTSWDNSPESAAVIAEMKIGVYYFAGHNHLDAGSFQLYYKGPLAVQSGIYQGRTGSYGSEHFRNYSLRTIAHNSLLVDQPGEEFTWHNREVVNDGGQRFPNGAREPDNLQELLSAGYKTGEVLAHSIGPDPIRPEYSYLKGELAEAYGDKVVSFQRSFVFLNLAQTDVPAALIVFDRVESSQADFKKTWLLHCVEEPVIEGNTTTVKRAGRGYNGQLVNTTILPAGGNLAIATIGGPGAEFQVQAQNFPQQILAEDHSGDGASWRIEISPNEASRVDHFFNVMQVMDYEPGIDNSLAVSRVETDYHIGVTLADRLVLFSKSGQLIGDSFSLEIEVPKLCKVLIADLQPGHWKVSPGDATELLVNRDQPLYFTAAAGRYEVTLRS